MTTTTTAPLQCEDTSPEACARGQATDLIIHDIRYGLARNIAIADSTEQHPAFDGISLPTLRRAVARKPDDTSAPVAG